ncbi:hypothetical protein [Actinomadura atramentaria]|uniref:hypothetical protein n=1 Tax=Actinomadura atramentaria TaxID=1990 RepID=UPI00036EA2CD|nr:hypothetical protein [Actinomadura atramentaria]
MTTLAAVGSWYSMTAMTLTISNRAVRTGLPVRLTSLISSMPSILRVAIRRPARSAAIANVRTRPSAAVMMISVLSPIMASVPPVVPADALIGTGDRKPSASSIRACG